MSPIARAFLAAFAVVLAAPAGAATLGLDPVAAPRLTVTADGFLEGGFLSITGDVTAQPAGLGLGDFQLSGFVGEQVALSIFDAPGAVAPAIEATLTATGFASGRLEFLFGAVFAGADLLGKRLLLIVEGATFTGDPFADGFEVAGGSGVIAAPVPLPAPAWLLLAAMAATAAAGRRRTL